MAKRRTGKVVTTFVGNGLTQADSVYLAGEFNDWNPTTTPMKKDRDGIFRANVALSPGSYRYKFVADGVWMHDPKAEAQEINPFGTLNSVVRVL